MFGSKDSIQVAFGLYLAFSFLPGCSNGQDPSFSEIDRKQLVLDVMSNSKTSSDATGVQAGANADAAVSTAGSDGIIALDDSVVDGLLNSTSGDAQTTKTASNTPDGDTSTVAGNTPDGQPTTGNSSTAGQTTATGNTTKGPGSSATQSGGNTSGSVAQVSSEAKLCAAHFGVSASAVIVAGEKKVEERTIDEASIVAIKIAGNQTHLDLMLKSEEARGIHGLCVFVTGNQGSVAIHVGVPLDGIVYYGRGNLSSGQIEIIEGGSVAELYSDLRGNGAALKVTGGDAGLCSQATLRGNQPQLTCE